MAGKARRRPSWKKDRGWYVNSKYYSVSYDKFSGCMSVMPKSLVKDIADSLLREITNSLWTWEN